MILEDFSLNAIEKNEQRRASKALNIEANKKMLLTGERLHFNLEVIDFMKPDYSLIENDFEKNLIKKFLSLPLIKNLKNPKIFKEYEFNDEIHLTNGIIDCLIIDNNEAIIIDYKLKNIDDEKYSKQLKVYVDFVVSYFKIHTKCYLYSILDGTLKEIII